MAAISSQSFFVLFLAFLCCYNLFTSQSVTLQKKAVCQTYMLLSNGLEFSHENHLKVAFTLAMAERIFAKHVMWGLKNLRFLEASLQKKMAKGTVRSLYICV